jgi:hypothetical protein
MVYSLNIFCLKLLLLPTEYYVLYIPYDVMTVIMLGDISRKLEVYLGDSYCTVVKLHLFFLQKKLG